jgi:hypothetical protein
MFHNTELSEYPYEQNNYEIFTRHWTMEYVSQLCGPMIIFTKNEVPRSKSLENSN